MVDMGLDSTKVKKVDIDLFYKRFKKIDKDLVSTRIIMIDIGLVFTRQKWKPYLPYIVVKRVDIGLMCTESKTSKGRYIYNIHIALFWLSSFCQWMITPLHKEAVDVFLTKTINASWVKEIGRFIAVWLTIAMTVRCKVYLMMIFAFVE